MQAAQLNIIDEIRERSFHSSLILSYSFDINYYENLILKELTSVGCRNNIVIIDSEQYSKTIMNFSSMHTVAGKHYSLVPVYCPNTFHPKIIMLFGETLIKVLIGSGNLNIGGYSLNKEAFYKLEFPVEDLQKSGLLISIWKFVCGVISNNKGAYLFRQIQSIQNEYAFLQAAGEGGGYSYDNNTGYAEFLVNEKNNSIGKQFVNKLKEEKVLELYVISPFFDKNSKAFSYLKDSLDPKETCLIVQQDSVNLNKDTIGGKNIRIYKYPQGRKHGYLHSKIYIVITEKHSHLLIGSANCTIMGLGTDSSKASNIEACIYERTQDASGHKRQLNIAELTDSKNLLLPDEFDLIAFSEDDERYTSPEVILKSVDSGGDKFFVSADKLDSYPKYSLCLAGPDLNKIIELDGGRSEKGGMVYTWKRKDSSIKYACLTYMGKVISNYVFISFQEDLFKNAPPPRSAQLYDVISKIKENARDLGDLIAPFEKLIFLDAHSNRTPFFSSAGSKDNGAGQGQNGPEFEEKITYEEFLQRTKVNEVKSFNKYYSSNSDIAVLIEFLMSKIGILKTEASSVSEKRYNAVLYDEEESDEELQYRPDQYYSYANNEHLENIKRADAVGYTKQIRSLCRKYQAYLDKLIMGYPEQGIPSPAVIDPIELIKFFSITLVVNHFAGKEYVIGGETIEVLDMGPGKNSYSEFMLQIVSKTFCYFDGRNKAFSVFRKIKYYAIDHDDMPPDILASILLGAYTLCTIWESSSEENLNVVRMAAYKFFLAVKLPSLPLDRDILSNHFEKFYNASGFKDKRSKLTQKKILYLNNILNRYYCIISEVVKVEQSLVSAEEEFNARKGKLPSPKAGTWVWHINTGLAFIEKEDEKGSVLIRTLEDGELRKMNGSFLVSLTI